MSHVQVSGDPSQAPAALEERVSGGLHWHEDGETEGPELLPMLLSHAAAAGIAVVQAAAAGVAAVPAAVMRLPAAPKASAAAGAPDQAMTDGGGAPEGGFETQFTTIPAPPSPFQQAELQQAYDTPRRPIPPAAGTVVRGGPT